MTPISPTLDRATAAVLVAHIVAMAVGFTLLGPVFDFPEVLRYPAEERFALFAANAPYIRAIYWVLTMTGITQIALSVQLFHVTHTRDSALATTGLIFGTLAGLCQALGFGRWVIVIPYLVAESTVPGQAGATALLEGAFNHYAGMLVGEHLANICWGIWLATISLVLLRATDLDRGLAWFGLALSPLMFFLAGEQVGVSGEILDPLVDFGFPLLVVWHLMLALQLARRAGSEHFAALSLMARMGGGALALALMLPAALG